MVHDRTSPLFQKMMVVVLFLCVGVTVCKGDLVDVIDYENYNMKQLQKMKPRDAKPFRPEGKNIYKIKN